MFPWMKAARMGAEVCCVMWLRALRISEGGTQAHSEFNLMITEKVEAALRAYALMLRGASAERIATSYSKAVARNLRRLSS
jgi:hypothetical protein